MRRSKARAVLIAFIIIATSGALLWGLFQGTQAVINGSISAGHLGQTVVYVIMLAAAFAVLGEVYGDLQRAAGATERLMELLHGRSAIESPPAAVFKPNRPAALVDAAQAAINFDAITFTYPSRPGQPSIHGLTLSVAPGETVALVGASGAGKTTLFQLLQRFYDPQQGVISVGGVPIAQQPLETLRGSIAVVPQDAVIFSASALENIRYGRPDATDDEVHAAAQAAFADEFIRALPEGYASFLGERGVRLSGGQRQRMAIARAMLKNAPVLLLDEATSALDTETERAVQEALDRLAEGRTTIAIAHRLSTIRDAEQIVVLEGGHVTERGGHAELVAAGGKYAQLAAEAGMAPVATVRVWVYTVRDNSDAA